MTEMKKINRRDFLQYTGVAASGLSLAAGFSSAAQGVPQDIVSGAVGKTEDFLKLNLFVDIAIDGTVRIVCHRSEMGQGIRTGLPQVLADELGADWEKVQVIQGQANKEYGSQNTDGSRSVRDFFMPMRKMGAAAKLMLEQAAAKVWDVSASECEAKDHRVSHKPSGRSQSFGELALLAGQEKMPDLSKLVLKSPSEFKYIGKGLASVDLQDMLQGSAQYGYDVKIEGMVYASIERCPVVGGTVKTFDASKAKSQTGVIDVVEIQGGTLPVAFHPLAGVAVIAENTWSAMEGRKKLDVQWNLGANARHNSEEYLKGLSKENESSGEPVLSRGDTAAAFLKSKKVIERSYSVPYLAHAPMEPPAATAIYKNGSVEVWACTQTPQSAQANIAKALGISEDRVIVHVTLLGGAFGRKSKPDFVVEAALLAKKISRPVKLCWTREDDIRHDYLHAINTQSYKGALADNNTVAALQVRSAFPSIMSTFSGADEPANWEMSQSLFCLPYDIPNMVVERQKAPAHMRIGWLRSVINIPHAFGSACFIDELAQESGKDRQEFLLGAIGNDRNIDIPGGGSSNYGKDINQYPYQSGRAKAVVKAVCKSASWGEKLPEGEAWGLAYNYSFLSHVAVAARVKWDGKAIKLLAIHCVADVGTVVNIDRVKSQFEGAMIFGASIALYSEITVNDGVTEQENFDGYRLTRMNECPDIKINIMESSNQPRGVGEPGVPPVAPAIINAIAAAGGPRIRDLPAINHVDIL